MIVCGAVLLFAFWSEMTSLEGLDAIHREEMPCIGEGDYDNRMMGTLGDVVEREGLRNRSLAVWGGTMAREHDLPFLYRVTADWFLLPAKPIVVIGDREEVRKYERILSPWNVRKLLEGEGYEVEQICRENFVYLYRIKVGEKGRGQ